MKKNRFLNSILRTAAALLMVLTLSLTAASPALALDLNPSDYFQFNFAPTAFSKSSVSAGEPFNAVIKGSADCTQDLPLPITEITITSKVIARPAAGGADMVLNPQYVINIKPLPNKAGESFGINQIVALQFPAGTAPGAYSVIGQVTKATVKVIVSLDVTGSFPKEQLMGTVKLGAAVTAAPAIIMPTVTTAAHTTTPITEVFPAINTTSTLLIAVIVLVIIVIALIVILAVVLMRRRAGM
jgi:hypothetical protein